MVLCYISPYIFKNVEFDCNRNIYYSFPYCMILVLSGCIASFLIFKSFRRVPKWLTFIGQNTLILYLWAGHAMLAFAVLNKIGVTLPDHQIWVSLVQTIWCTFACMVIAATVNKRCPLIVGKQKSK